MLLALSASACVHPRHDVGTYFPLEIGNRWTYEVSGVNPRTDVVEILAIQKGDRGETRYVLSGSKTEEGGARVYIRAEELVAMSVSAGIWSVYISGPLELGHRFSGAVTTNEGFHVEGETESVFVAQRPDQEMVPVREAGYKVVTSFDRSVTVPAGTFTGCLEVAHLVGTIVGVKYFAPQVGLVLSEAWNEDRAHHRRSLVSRQALTAYSLRNQTAAGK